MHYPWNKSCRLIFEIDDRSLAGKLPVYWDVIQVNSDRVPASAGVRLEYHLAGMHVISCSGDVELLYAL